jgi:glycosyltransferase involved in cell wall biosynthesis
MKISLFFDNYQQWLETKDPGQILLGLLEAGVDTSLICVRKQGLADYAPKFPVTQVKLDDLQSEQFWSKNDSDVILAYTWLSDSYTPLLEKMKLGGKKVLVKSDSDGRIGYPLPTSYLRVPLRDEASIRSLARHVWWRLPFKSLHSKKAMQRIRQIEISDGVIIESPDALSNLNYFLTAWGRKDLIKKTCFVPNPVTPEFIYSEIGKKENIVVASGRWWDDKAKNTQLMAKTMVEFLKERRDYSSIIVGNGTEKVQSCIGDIPGNVRERLNVVGFTELSKIKDILSKAKIILTPSRWESFSLASCEAVCMGCSVVATPVESLRYLSMQGFSGTVSSTFSKDAVLAALIQDSTKWDRGDYEPEKIAAFWRAKMNRKSVAESIASLVHKPNS